MYMCKYLIGNNLYQVQLLLSTVSEREWMSPQEQSESLDHQQLVQDLSNRSCRNQYTMLMATINTYVDTKQNEDTAREKVLDNIPIKF